MIFVPVFQFDAAPVARKPLPIQRQAIEQTPQGFGSSGKTLIEKTLIQTSKRQDHPAFGIGLLLTHDGDHCVFQRTYSAQHLAGGVGAADFDIGAQQGVFFNDPGLDHVAKNPHHRQGVVLQRAVWGLFLPDLHRGQLRQLVGAKPLVGIAIEDSAQYLQPLPPDPPRKMQFVDLLDGFIHGAHQGLNLQDIGFVLIAADKIATLQHRDRCVDLGGGHRICRMKSGVDLFVAKNLSGGDDHGVFVIAFGAAQPPEDLRDVMTAQA